MRRKLLIVDDNSIERKVLNCLLKIEYDTMIAETGYEALSLLSEKSSEISAILLDLIMPKKDGFEVLKEIKQTPKYMSIPVIITSSLDNEEAHEMAIKYGANGFVTKPFNQPLLVNTIQNAIKLCETAARVDILRNDRLTGIYTRESFLEVASELINSHESGYYVLSCFNIENFKIINDQYGTEKGDKVLKHVADCIKSCVDEIGGIVCRVAADNFAILYPSSYSNSEIIRSNHLKTVSPHCINRKIRIRIGRYEVNDLSLSVSVMFDRATMAAETVKGKYDIYIASYDDSLRKELLHEQQIVNDMYGALEAGEFEPWFQPQYDHTTGGMIGAEALVRWKKEDKYISPGEFVPVFERNGFVFEMDQYIWEQVCKLMRKWMNEGRSPLPVSVNISRNDLIHDDCVSTIVNLVNKYKLPYDLIRLEVTESAFSESTNIIVERVVELIDYGFTVEIDDFGSGYSSLNTLKDVPASIMKLDMKFFENTGNSERSGNIIESVVRMAKWLGMAIIAEGVEDKSQADFLKSIGCYYIQGYYYAKPMPLSDYEARLDASKKEPELAHLKTLETFDNNEFWNPKSMETLIFNSYVGGACIFENTSDNNSTILRTNDRYENELGYFSYSGSPLAKKNLFDFIDKESTARLTSSINECKRTGSESTCEIVLSDSVHIEFIRSTIRPIARAGERYLFYCVLVNITEQRMIEKKERANEERLKVIMGNINGGVSALQIFDNGKSHIIFSNDRYYDLYGYTMDEAIYENLDVMSLIHPDDLPIVLKKVKKLKENKIPVVIDYRCKKKNGKLTYLRANAAMMHLDGYDEDVITSVVVDITEQREISDQLRAIIDNINGGVSATVIRDNSPEFVVVNDNFFKILGFESQEQYYAETKDRYAYIHPDDRDRIVKIFSTRDGGKSQYTMEYRIVRRDGAVRYIRNNISVVNIFGVDEPVQLSVANDVTDVYLAQQSEQETNDRLKAVMNHAGNGITAVAVCEDASELLFSNDKFYEIIGYTREEFAGITSIDAFSIIDPRDIDNVRKVAMEVNKTGISNTVNFRLTPPNKGEKWIKVYITLSNLYNIAVPVQIAVFSDITEEINANRQLEFLNEVAHDLLAKNDTDKAINSSLEKLMEFFDGERSYVFEFDYEKEVANNTYEICKEGVLPEINNLKGIPISVSQYWIDAFNQGNLVVIENVDAIEDEKSEMRELLKSQNIHSLIVAPLWRDEILIGLVGIDNPSKSLELMGHLKALGDYLAVLLTRRDLNYKIEHDTKSIKMLMDDTPGGFCRMEIIKGDKPRIVSMNDGFAKLLGMTQKEVLEVYGNDAYKYFSNEDVDRLSADTSRAIETVGQFTTKCKLRRKDGSFIKTMIFGRFVNDLDGRLFLNSYFTDVTEQESVAESLRIAEEEYRIAVEQSGIVICRYNIATHRLVITSKDATRLSLAEVLEDVPYDRVRIGKISPDTSKDYIKFYEKIMAGEPNCSVIFEKLLSDGWHWIEAHSTTVFSASGKATSALITYRKINEPK